ncbi:MAG: tRNA (adenosine(37)-N6)-threonylcarbamoyltransferase complex transferase subunit TsaD [Phycisphaerales bacterium]|nr:tRNA (adenosine(37)-N6)-threonylcarbamoyltransferase complex transferase subunit TsaD [Phycisphaerales bacterium]
MPPSSTILAFETSCDETAVAVVRHGREVLSNVIASQHDLHAEYRGVVPEIASRAHAERITPVLRRALADAGVTLKDITAVAVGNRPGLIGSLLVGVASAKALAWSLGVPMIGVDHVHAHLLAGLLGPAASVPGTPRFPALGLVVSGGHTSLYVCESTIRVRRIGATIDDAVGEAYDKVAAILDLPFPGGPSLDKLAQTGKVHAPGFPIARIAPDSLDFSFSGLKTAALYAFRGVPEDDRRRAKRESRGEALPPLLSAPDVAATFQESAIGAVMLKLRRAMERFPDCRTLLVGGGVSANSKLRRELEDLRNRTGMDVRIPPMQYCLDNAAMIAALAHDQLAERSWAGDELSVSAVPTTAF